MEARAGAEKLLLAARCKSIHVNERCSTGKCRSPSKTWQAWLRPRFGKLANDKVMQYAESISGMHLLGLFVLGKNDNLYALLRANTY